MRRSARVIEKRMFTQVEDLLPVISFESKKDNDTADQAQRVRQAHARARLHPAPGAPARRMVHAREQGGVAGRVALAPQHEGHPRWRARPVTMRMTHFIDRRLNPKGKSLGNRQRFLRRARAQIREAVQKSLKDSAVADHRQGPQDQDFHQGHARAALPARSARRRRARFRAARQQGVHARRRDQEAARAATAASAASRRPIPAKARTISNSP